MQNSARLQQLGIPDKSKEHQRSREDSESDYEPSQEDSAEQDLVDDDISKVITFPSRKNNNQTSDVPPVGVMFRARRGSKRINFRPDASLPPSGNHVPPPSHPDVSQQLHENTMAEIADANTQPAGDTLMTNEGEDRWNRGVNMGHGLQRMNRSRRGKLPIIKPEGYIRPVVPDIASKYATECNITVRNHVPVLKHWKEYKKHPVLFDLFLGILCAKFYIDTNDAIVRHGCIEMMKSAVRQQRHWLKKDDFDPFPLHLVSKTSPIKSTSNEQWMDLEACQKNKDNRGNVKFHQTTSSRSYPVFVENLVSVMC
ncbi:hypothetical protein PVAP13_8KG064884 [Panicum virgatum]|uniref:Uncharacterized protein n=1 Tax=Panicum virgatum TaxID=38727 RepID=A0A8T0PG02_PANVG|nr:hypothetical protein PVAP13_8KG064884 [Panicum virgatum]